MSPDSSTYDYLSIQNTLFEALLAADRVAAERIRDRVSGEISPMEFADHVIVPVLEKIGYLWDKGNVALAQVYMSGRICEKLLDSLLADCTTNKKQHFPIGIAVLADQHVLGKRIVHSVIRSAGYSVIDFGAGISAATLAEKVVAENIKVLFVSTLMLPSALRIKELSSLLKNQDVKIVVGGAPFLFDNELWSEVGADAMGRNAADAIKLLQKYEEEMA